MTPYSPPPSRLARRGIEVQAELCPVAHASNAETLAHIERWLASLQLQSHVQIGFAHIDGHSTFSIALTDTAFAAWTPDFDTLEMHARLGSHTPSSTADLRREIAVAMLASPYVFVLPSVAELLAAIDVRSLIAQAAHECALAFATEAAERPESHWHYDEAHGFLLRPGVELEQALLLATQPKVSGHLYDFSCYRATEYLMLLGLTQALRLHNPVLHCALQHQCEVHAIRSAQFHDVFCIEYGSMEAPLPACCYVPGDRLWFRNPDEVSADVTGYEGSWVMYMGGGLFTNSWRRKKPFTLAAKCLEIFHWRHGCYRDAQGELRMDETRVEAHVAQTLLDPQQTQDAIARMMRLRDPRGVYARGGCIDPSREYPRWISMSGGNLTLPAMQGTASASQALGPGRWGTSHAVRS